MAPLFTRSHPFVAKDAEHQRRTPRPTLAPIKTCDDDSRWSTVPPRSALTFVAMWDPNEGMIGFSGSSLLPLETCKDLPVLPTSKVLPAIPHKAKTPALNTATRSSDLALDDIQALLDAYPPEYTRWREDSDECSEQQRELEAARASSTLMGLYTCEKQLGASSRTLVGGRDVPRDIEFDADSEICSYSEYLEDSDYFGASDSRTVNAREIPERPVVDSFFIYNEYPYVSDNERSHFSTTTTSTSRYVNIESPVSPELPETPLPETPRTPTIIFRPRAPEPSTPESSIWSSVDKTEMDSLNLLAYVHPRPPLPHMHSAPSPNTPRKPNKLSKSRSQFTLPASPDPVLTRDAYSHEWYKGPRSRTPSNTSPTKPRLTRVISRGILGMRKTDDDNSWVRIEIGRNIAITQHVLQDV